MDIEQLKLIFETVSSVSNNAQSVAIFWIAVDKILPIVCWMIVFGVLMWRTPFIVHSFAGSSKFIAWARDEINTGTRGFLTEQERLQTEERLRELIEKSKKLV